MASIGSAITGGQGNIAFSPTKWVWGKLFKSRHFWAALSKTLMLFQL
jgi:hypothetical protein